MTLEEMRKRKKQLGYSNAELSNLTGIPIGTMNKILSGVTKKPRPENWEALEQVLQDTTYQYGTVSAAPYMLREEGYYGTSAEERGKRPGEFTIDDYYALPDDKRVELINGVFYDMAAPSIVHQVLLESISWQFRNFIMSRKGKCLPLVSPVDVKLDKDNKTMVQPDFIVVCDRSQITEKRVEGGPDFVLEVISPSSVQKDCILKAAKYLEAGVKEYWILDPDKKIAVIYHFPETCYPTILPLEGKLPVAVFNNELEIDLDLYKEILEG